MNEDRIEQLAGTTAKWWAEQIRSPDLSNFDVGDQSHAGDIDKFERSLKAKFKTMLQKETEIFLMVDYYPDHVLVDAAKKAGLMESSKLGFPQNTWMEISDANGIRVKKGYGGTPETILW